MRNVIFFTQNRWAFANIHHSLVKALYSYGIHAEILDFTVSYKTEEICMLDEWADLFITNPDAVPALMSYGVSYSKIAAVAHAQWDILRALELNPNIFNYVQKYAVVSDHLVQKSKDFGIVRVPETVKIGIITEKYDVPPPSRLKKIGYAGAYSVQNFYGQEIKRGYLVDKILDECKKRNLDLEYVKHDFYIWQAMPTYYKSIDLLLITSVEEGAGIPYMEALASARGVISTSVGYADEEKIGDVFSIDENSFVDSAINKIYEYYHDSKRFSEKCEENKKRSCCFDWSIRVKNWVDFILSE